MYDSKIIGFLIWFEFKQWTTLRNEDNRRVAIAKIQSVWSFIANVYQLESLVEKVAIVLTVKILLSEIYTEKAIWLIRDWPENN